MKEIGSVEPTWIDGWGTTASFILGALQKYAGNHETELSLMRYIQGLVSRRIQDLEGAYKTINNNDE